MEKEGDRKYERDCKGKRELGNKENEGRKWKEESGRGSSKEVKKKKINKKEAPFWKPTPLHLAQTLSNLPASTSLSLEAAGVCKA